MRTILWDIDGTLLDFGKAEYEAIKKCFEVFGLGVCTDEMVKRYSVINKGYWERLERGEITKPEVLVGRFRDFFKAEGIDSDCAEAFNKEYQVRLGDTICFCDNGYELVQSLRGKVKQYAVTNGTKIAQEKKLLRSGLGELFDGVFISEEVGVEKPGVGFFEHIWKTTDIVAGTDVIIVGDSLTSDMQGGNNAGILCCWYNPSKKPANKNLRIDYEIESLGQLSDILRDRKWIL